MYEHQNAFRSFTKLRNLSPNSQFQPNCPSHSLSSLQGLHQIPKTEISHLICQLRDIRGGTIAPNSLPLAMTRNTQRDSISLQSPNAPALNFQSTALALYYNARRHPFWALQSFNWIGVRNFQENTKTNGKPRNLNIVAPALLQTGASHLRQGVRSVLRAQPFFLVGRLLVVCWFR